jgi:hypothetical protein
VIVAELTELLPWSGLGLSGIVSLVVLLVLTGRLVPRSVMDDRVADWKAAAEASERRAAERDEQQRELLEMGRTTVQILEALRDSAGAGGRG